MKSMFLILTTVVAVVLVSDAASAQVRFDVLHALTGADGAFPEAPLVQATDGNLYGTTSEGGAAGKGTIFRITPSGTFAVLHSFTGMPDGSWPSCSLIQATDGNSYGTTPGGGAADWGTIFAMTPAGVVTVLYGFAAPDGGLQTA